jgi:hypothetical protein
MITPLLPVWLKATRIRHKAKKKQDNALCTGYLLPRTPEKKWWEQRTSLKTLQSLCWDRASAFQKTMDWLLFGECSNGDARRRTRGPKSWNILKSFTFFSNGRPYHGSKGQMLKAGIGIKGLQCRDHREAYMEKKLIIS